MDVVAYNCEASGQIELGGIADSIWTQGFKYSQERTIQVSKPINAPVPNLFNRITRTNQFSFAAGRSFASVGEALLFLGTHADLVPVLADLQFTSGGQQIWLRYCGIQRIELIEKRGALVIFGYPIIGGTWAKTRS